MKEIGIAMGMLTLIGDDAACDKIIAEAAMRLLARAKKNEEDPADAGGVDPELEKPQPEIKKKPAAANKQQKAAAKQQTKKTFDTGKMIALLKAGWSVAKIADEMGVSDQTIRNRIKQEGIVLKKQ